MERHPGIAGACAGIALAACLPATGRADTFDIETVDVIPSGGYWTHTSIAIGGPFEAAVAYNQRNASGVVFAYRSGGVWYEEMIDARGTNPALALDPAGVPHVVYADGSYLRIASRGPGGWAHDVVQFFTTGGFFTGSPSLVFDAGGKPHVGYYSTNNAEVYRLHYTTLSGGAIPRWAAEIVDGTGEYVGANLSLAVDADGLPWIAYTEGTGGGSDPLRIARRPVPGSDSWVFEDVDAGGFDCSLAFDPAGVPHVTYRGPFVLSDWELRHASKPGETWLVETVEDGGRPRYTALGIDTAGDLWVGYSLIDTSTLRLARKSGGSWATAFVEGGTVHGLSLALDSAGLPWLAYVQDLPDEIRVARLDGAALTVPPPSARGLAVGAPYPNPSRGPVSLAVRTPREGDVMLRLVDVAGRVVDRHAARAAGGAGVVTWDLRDVVPGVYYLSVEVDGQRESRRVVRVR